MTADIHLPEDFRPELVAADLDGTLLAPDLSIDSRLPGALAGLKRAGVETVVCTGRMVASARKVTPRLGLHDGPMVCYQGAVVADLATGEWLRHVPMDSRVAAEVVRHARSIGRHLNAYIDDELLVEVLDEWAREYAEHVEVGIRRIPDLEAAVLERRPTKLVIIASIADVERLLPELQARWRGRLYITRSQPEYIEFCDPGVSKSVALTWLAARLRVRREGIAALGDGMNDVDMLRWAGLGVAVAEAAEPVRAAADLVVPRAEVPALLDALTERRAAEA